MKNNSPFALPMMMRALSLVFSVEGRAERSSST
jgi:hypothetical protein